MNPSSEVEEVLSAVLEGKRLSKGDALKLAEVRGDDLLFLSLVARKITREKAGEVVTYVVNRNINFTNVCVGSCSFCAFRRGVKEDGGFLLGLAEIVKKAEEAARQGATEVCIQGGLHPEIDLDYYTEMVRKIKETADLHVHAFSPMEVYSIAEKSGLGIKETLRCLKEAGVDSIPGTAAEILDDRIRKIVCPKKLGTEEWIEVIKEAHREGIPTTATIMYGHVEGAEDQVSHLSKLRAIQDETGGFFEFIPLSFVHFNTPLYRSGKAKGGATGTEDMRLFALSRVFLDNFRNIQASWIKLGSKFAQVMLNFGANDLGGTLMEESISLSAGSHNEMLGEEELRRMIVGAGKVPRRRGTLYDIIE